MTLARYAADRVLDELEIKSPVDLRALDPIAWERGAAVLYEPLRGSEARLLILGKKAIITVSALVEDPHRRRFSVAHELGHLELHRRHCSMFLCSSSDISDLGRRGTDKTLEYEANEFAAAILLPERFLAPQCKRGDPSLDHISELADTFDVSLTATALRYLQFCDEACALVFSHGGYMKWFEPSREFKNLELFIPAPGPLDAASLAGRFFRQHPIPRKPMRVKAEYWFEPGGYREGATVVEQSWPMPNYDAVLTLLWVDQDIDEDEA